MNARVVGDIDKKCIVDSPNANSAHDESSELPILLHEGLCALQIRVNDQQQSKLINFVSMLHKWNAKFNLTSIKSQHHMMVKHVFDSLSVLSFLHGHRVVDVGSGAGLPGIPLAIIAPDRSFVLLDGNRKKTRFMHQVVQELGLRNVCVINARVEKFQTNEFFDTIITRAFASIPEMIDLTAHLWNDTGLLLAMKGRYPHQEVEATCEGFRILDVTRVDVPKLSGERHIVRIKRVELPKVG